MLNSLFIWISGLIQINTLKYLSLKPLEQKCIDIENGCNSVTETFMLKKGNNLLQSFTLHSSTTSPSLKKMETYNTFLESTVEIKIVHRENNYRDLNIMTLQNINIDDKFNLLTYVEKYLFTCKIKLMDKKEFKINFMTFSIYATTTYTKLYAYDIKPNIYSISNFINLNYRFVRPPFQSKSMYVVTNSYCENNNWNGCKESFLIRFPFKDKNQNLVKKEDSIFDHYLLDGFVEEKDFKFSISYKYQTALIEDSQDYPDVDESLFKFPIKNVIECTFVEEKGLKNINCKCQDGYIGIDCSHKLRETRSNCEYFEMCGAYGSCKKGTNECQCIEGWSGKYCTKSNNPSLNKQSSPSTSNTKITTKDLNIISISKIKNTTESPPSTSNTKITTKDLNRISISKIQNTTVSPNEQLENESKNSKIKIILVVVISCVAMSIIIVAIIIFIFKNRT